MLSQVLINVVCLQSVAVAETCDHDLTSALQTQAAQVVRHGAADVSASQVDRVFEAIRNTASDAEVICVSAQAGEEAPFPGTFTPVSGHKVEVGVGHRASESGEYCVQNSLVSLMQRATIDGQAKNFEGVVAAKNTEKSTSGKNKKKKEKGEVCVENCCGGASNMCKVMVKSDLRDGGIVCSSKRNETELEAEAASLGCVDISQIDAVCQSDCKMTCDELLSGSSLSLKTARQAIIGTMPADLLTEMLSSIPSPSAVYCCQPDESGLCPEVEGRKTMKQAGVWDATVAEFNHEYKLKDVCTSGHVEAKCAELNNVSP